MVVTSSRWGHIFESVLDMYIIYMLNTIVHETGNIPGVLRKANGIPVQNYSPDGVALVQKADYKYLIDGTSQKYTDTLASACKSFRDLPEELILLMEYKNPYRRVPLGVIKDHYKAQPKAGMCTIPITEAALFVDGVFKKCSIRDFDLSRTYDVKFHCIHGKCRRLTYESAKACGFVGIMDTSKPFADFIDDKVNASNDSDWGYSDDEENSGESLSEHSEKDESFEDEVLPRITAEEKSEVSKRLAKYCIRETKHEQSDFNALNFDLAHFPSLVRLMLAFFHNITDQGHFKFTDIMFEDEIEILTQAAKQLFIYQMVKDVGKAKLDKKKLRASVEIAKEMLPNIIDQFTYKPREYDLEDLPYGEDYGETNVAFPTAADFEEMVEKLIERDRFADQGYKMYHPKKFFFDVESEDASKLMKDNYIDYTKEQDDSAKKWLYYTVKEFVDYCREQDVRPHGIIPWKMFEVCCMPMYKDPDFLTEHEEKIRDTVEIIDAIQAACPVEDVEGRMELLAKYYKPPRAKKTRAKKIAAVVNGTTDGKKAKNNFDQETEDFCADWG